MTVNIIIMDSENRLMLSFQPSNSKQSFSSVAEKVDQGSLILKSMEVRKSRLFISVAVRKSRKAVKVRE